MIIELRLATKDLDGPTIAEIYLKSFHTTLPSITLAHSDDECRQHFSTTVIDDYETWSVVVDDEIVGFLALSSGHIDHLYLHPDWTGNGIGQRCIELAKHRRPEGIELWAFAINEGARRFYERHGFVAKYFGDGRDNEEGEPDVLYAWAPERYRAEP